MRHNTNILLWLSLAVALLFTGCATTSPLKYATPTTKPVVAPLDDPLEPINRAIHSFDVQLESAVLSPIARGYRHILPISVRTGIGNFCSNLGYPLKAGTHLLAGDCEYAWEDVKRFSTNLTVGMLGFKDIAAANGMTPIPGGFDTTFHRWGLQPGPYLVLPFTMGKTLREYAGSLCDFLLNPVSYLAPAKITLSVNAFGFVNNAATIEPSVTQLLLTDPDHYELGRLFAHYRREIIDQEYWYDPDGKLWEPDDSFAYLLFAPNDPNYLYSGESQKLSSETMGKIPYTIWTVPNASRLVFILPGIGNHRLDNSVLALAELLNRQGYSAIAISSPFTPDFFKTGTGLPPAGYIPEDARILSRLLAELYTEYQKKYPSRNLKCAVLGFSLGGIQTLHIAASAPPQKMPEIDRYIAINPPADPFSSTQILDRFFSLPQTWHASDEKQTEAVQDLIMRLAAYLMPNHINPIQKKMPLTREESLFLLGINMRMHLSTAIRTLEKLQRIHLLTEKPQTNAAYAEALNISFSEYLEKVVLAWYQNHALPNATLDSLIQRSRLQALAPKLRDNPKVFLFHNANDPILSEQDIPLFTRIFGSRAHIFPQGGHLGNLILPEVQKAILQVLSQADHPESIPSPSVTVAVHP